MAKNNALSLEKKNRNMSPLLQKCNNITIEYYDTIKKEFQEFQKKYFIDGPENNIFNFRLNDNKENINTYIDSRVGRSVRLAVGSLRSM